MGGTHKHHPIPFRPGIKPGDPDRDGDWLRAYAAETGRSVSAIVSEAVAEYRATAKRATPLRDAAETGTANRAIAAELHAFIRKTTETGPEETK